MNTKLCPTCSTPIPAAAPGGFCPACLLRDAAEPAATGQSAPSLEEVAAAFPSLEILSLIGQGGMGSVYKVRQPNLDRIVALKLLAPALSRDPAFAERFAREARVLGKLNHPNIVSVYEHGESGGFYYLIMEYVDGVNLRQAMRAGRFTPEQALAIVPGICDALQAAHAQGIWHRDIKPENILLDQRGGVKIADFGIARLVGDQTRNFTLTATGNALGSAAYMAPEQHESPHTVDHRADIYSLGVVIYEMLTGELPLGRFPAPSQRAAVSARIDEIVLQTLEKERELRQQSAMEVKTDVQSAGSSEVKQAPPIGQPARLTLAAVTMVIGGLMMFGAAAAFTFGSTQGVLLVISVVASVLGYIATWTALSQMRNGILSKAWRPALRWIAWSPPVLALAAGIAVAVYFGSEYRPHQSESAQERSERLRQQAEQKAMQGMMDVLVAAAQKAGVPPVGTPAPTPTPEIKIIGPHTSSEEAKAIEQATPKESLEEVIRALNLAANSKNLMEFHQRSRQNPIIIEGSSSDKELVALSEQFVGTIQFLEAKFNPSYLPSQAGGMQFSALHGHVKLQIERPTGKIARLDVALQAEADRWALWFVKPGGIVHHGQQIVEFSPPGLDAAAWLKSFPSIYFQPMKERPGYFSAQTGRTVRAEVDRYLQKSLEALKAVVSRQGYQEHLKVSEPVITTSDDWKHFPPIPEGKAEDLVKLEDSSASLLKAEERTEAQTTPDAQKPYQEGAIQRDPLPDYGESSGSRRP